MKLSRIVILFVICWSTVTAPCPFACICPPNTVRCLHQQLRTIPVFDIANLVVLDLRFNEITAIETNTFANSTTFRQLTTLLLNNNYLEQLHNAVFSGMASHIELIDLSRNRIRSIAAEVFANMPKLEKIYLSVNKLHTILPRTFVNLPQLKRLFLSSNNLKRLRADIFMGVGQLQLLKLDQNPLECSCDLRWLIRFGAEVSASCGDRTLQMFVANKCQVEYKILDCIGRDDDDDDDGVAKGNVRWMKDSKEIVADNDRYWIFDNGSLLISSNASVSDAGHYECFSDMKHEPVFIRKPINMEIEPGTNVDLECEAVGRPKPEIYWSRNDIRLVPSQRIVQDAKGTLHIRSVSDQDYGLYRCHASNSFGQISTAAQLKVFAPPIFTKYPDSQVRTVGERVQFECIAAGSPAPTLSWYFNSTLNLQSVSDRKYRFGSNASRLEIVDLIVLDSGTYSCKASNLLGTIKVTANLTVRERQQVRRPKLAVKPYDKEVLEGTTIEIPCKLDIDEDYDEDDSGPDAGDEIPEIVWRKDGTVLGPNARFKVSALGTLYIKNFGVDDVGRYECSAANEAGHDAGHALITIKTNANLRKIADRYVKTAISEAEREIDRAIQNTLDGLFSRRNGNSTQNRLDSHDLFRLFRYPDAPARELARAADIYDRTLSKIRSFVRDGFNLTHDADDFDYKEILSADHLKMISELSGCLEHQATSNCTNRCQHRKYRTINGLCNNFANPTWGAALTSFQRLLRARYEDGVALPIGWQPNRLYNGFRKPDARLVSQLLIRTRETHWDNRITHMVMQWGQFLDHDLDHAIPSVSSESWDGVDCRKTCARAAPCFPIDVPANDTRIRDRRCIDFFRSSAICGSGMTSVFFEHLQVREQINQLTAFVDGSQVYGSAEQLAANLRDGTGRLREGLRFANRKGLLPFTNGFYGMDCRRNVTESNIGCFLAGDIRVNEQIGLTAMHTLWLREHNRIVDRLRAVNPHWPSETLFHEARKVVGAEMQHITYQYWLPAVFGRATDSILGSYNGYDPSLNPAITNVFATAAMRFGHTLINPIIYRLENDYRTPIVHGHLELHKAFFAPWRLTDEGGIDPILRGMIAMPAKHKRTNEYLNSELTERLFEVAHAVALDLAAINIQRGRDHGLPGYFEYRRYCRLESDGERTRETFDDLIDVFSNQTIRERLQQLYGHPANIDVWVGGILEDNDAVNDSKLGPLFECLISDQFRRLRDGDRFYYENPGVFRPEQLHEIRKVTLARIVCDNGDNITDLWPNVFELPYANENRMRCDQVPAIDFGQWSECCDSCAAAIATASGRSRRSINDTTEDQTNRILRLERDLRELRDRFESLLLQFNRTC